MAINDDIDWYYSGSGTAVTSLGSAIHANQVIAAADQNIFQNITSPLVQSKQYFCVYLKNNGAVTYNVGIYTSTPTPSNDTSVYIAKGTSAVNGTEQVIANKETEPIGVLWTQRYFDYQALSIATLTAGQTQAIWLRLDQLANAGGSSSDYCILTLKAL